MLGVLLVLNTLAAQAPIDSLVFLEPSVVLSAEDKARLDRGETIARVLPGEGLEVAVFAAQPVNIDGDRLVAWVRRIEALKKSSYVLAIGRFSNVPRIEDLADLSLDDDELSEIRSCRRGRCALKLSVREMTQLQQTADAAGRSWRPAVQQAFRQLVLERAQAYLAGSTAEAYDDGDDPVSPQARFTELLERSAFLTAGLPEFAGHLLGYPQTMSPGVESFVYWSKERLARKSVVSVTHVNILRSGEPGLPDALVASRNLFSTHYINASIGVTAVLRGAPGHHNYLVYLNRSDVDVLGGRLGGLVRWFMQRRLRDEATGVLRDLRERLESGNPPSAVD
jgi:hypothetical protein